MPKKPSPLHLPKVAPKPVVHERETIRSEGSSGELEQIGRRYEGLDGKRYVGSVAMHFYEVRRQGGIASVPSLEYVYLIQSTDLTQIPETVMVAGLPEMGRALMLRYGRKPPSKTTDANIRETERKVNA